jgi:hypothetical protein
MPTPRKSTPNRSTPSKSTPRKSPSGKATPRKSTEGKSTPRNPAQRSAPANRRTARTSSNGHGESPRAKPKSLRTIAVTAAAELAELIGQTPEGIVGVDKNEDGWRVLVEVVESRRIPETTDIMAVYEVDVDSDATVTGYRRMDRYVRGRIQE